MTMPNVHDDDTETLLFADESEWMDYDDDDEEEEDGDFGEYDSDSLG